MKNLFKDLLLLLVLIKLINGGKNEERKQYYTKNEKKLLKSELKGVYNKDLYLKASENDIKKSIEEINQLSFDTMGYIQVDLITGDQTEFEIKDISYDMFKNNTNINNKDNKDDDNDNDNDNDKDDNNNNNSTDHDNDGGRRRRRRLSFYIDDRIQIYTPTITNNPYKYIGLIRFQDSNNEWHSCSGTLVGPRDVLTSGHCLHSGGDYGDWYHNFYFYLQLYDSGFFGQIYDSGFYKGSYAISNQGWLKYANFAYDYGILKLDIINTNYGYMIFGDSYNIDIRTWLLSGTGYTNDKKFGTLWKTQCYPQYIYDHYFIETNDCMTFHGMDGTNMYAFDSIIFGIYSKTIQYSEPIHCENGPDGTVCTQTSAVPDQINHYMRITPYKHGLICDMINNIHVC